jgi:hypothetical protein
VKPDFFLVPFLMLLIPVGVGFLTRLRIGTDKRLWMLRTSQRFNMFKTPKKVVSQLLFIECSLETTGSVKKT